MTTEREFLMYGQRGHGHNVADNSIWDTGQFAPLEPSLEALWEGEARGMLAHPGCQCQQCAIYVKGYLRGSRMRERNRRNTVISIYDVTR